MNSNDKTSDSTLPTKLLLRLSLKNAKPSCVTFNENGSRSSTPIAAFITIPKVGQVTVWPPMSVASPTPPNAPRSLKTSRSRNNATSNKVSSKAFRKISAVLGALNRAQEALPAASPCGPRRREAAALSFRRQHSFAVPIARSHLLSGRRNFLAVVREHNQRQYQ